MTDLVTLAQAQSFVQDSTSASEPWVQSCVDAASQAVIDYLGVDPTSQTRMEIISGANTGFLYPRGSGKPAPITGVTSISINPALTVAAGGWWGFGVDLNEPTIIDMTKVSFDQDTIFLSNGQIFPRGKRNITVTYTSGYALQSTAGIPDLPNSITQAVLYTVKGFFTAMGKELNATSESYSGVMSQSFFAGGPGAVPPAAQMILRPYQVKMFSP